VNDDRAEATQLVVVGKDDLMPESWHASVLITGPGPPGPASWRAEAIERLRAGWNGAGRLVVFTTRADDGASWTDDDYRWLETRAGHADVIMFWLGADDPAQSVNHVIWGACEGSGRVVLGSNGDGAGDAYLRRRAADRGVPVAATVASTVDHVLTAVGAGARRAGAHRQVPLPLWHTPSFRYWLTSKERSGHRLEETQVAWSSPLRPVPGVFLWAVRPRLAIGGEQRVKGNEVVLGRTDVVSVVAYRSGPDLAGTEIALVREFRSPAATRDGYVHELPGGSVEDHGPLPTAAADEFGEETGLAVGVDRLRRHGARQPLGTLCAHRQHLFSVELTTAEIAELRATTATFGLMAEGEQTTVEVRTLGQILADDLVDWTTLGLICGALGEVFGLAGRDRPSA
jgi:8-oxo-dGTP pyrophosphatase MutT (NUDIX family)